MTPKIHTVVYNKHGDIIEKRDATRAEISDFYYHQMLAEKALLKKLEKEAREKTEVENESKGATA